MNDINFYRSYVLTRAHTIGHVRYIALSRWTAHEHWAYRIVSSQCSKLLVVIKIGNAVQSAIVINRVFASECKRTAKNEQGRGRRRKPRKASDKQRSNYRVCVIYNLFKFYLIFPLLFARFICAVTIHFTSLFNNTCKIF